MDVNERIERWEKMVHEVPDDMAWFSLGTAYKDAGRLEDAAEALRKAIELNEQMSRAYQLLGQVLIHLERQDEAARVLTHGYEVAAKRRDVMPQRAMASLLQTLNKPLPRVAEAQPEAAAVPEGVAQIVDRRSGRPGTRMTEPPMRGPIGKFIVEHYSQETWREWIHQGTKVINELRLDFSNEEHQRAYDQAMMEWLGFNREEAEKKG